MRFTKRLVAWSMSLVMALTTISSSAFSTEVKAEEAPVLDLPSVTAFATKADLVDKSKFSLLKEDGGVPQKVNFGNDKKWYIAGAQHNCGDDDCDDTSLNELVLMCSPQNPLGQEQVFHFFASEGEKKEYREEMGCYDNYIMWSSDVVTPDHYGASDIRKYLRSLYGADNVSIFSAAQQKLMMNTKVYTKDKYNSFENKSGDVVNYSTSDKLYLAYGQKEENYITVGANSATNLNDGIKIGCSDTNAPKDSPYAINDGSYQSFWLRTPDEYNLYNYADGLLLQMGTGVIYADCSFPSLVVPAFNLDLSSVLFASTAYPSTEDATLSDSMTFRMDGTDKFTCSATACEDKIYVKKGSGCYEYIYVQGKTDNSDWVYSKQILRDETISIENIKSEKNLSDIDLTKCKIWIEKTDDSVTYAKPITATKHDFTDSSLGFQKNCKFCGEENPNKCGDNAYYTYDETKKTLDIYGTGRIEDGVFSHMSTSEEAFRIANEVTKITIHKGITEIGNNAFYACANCLEIVFPDGLKKIGTDAIYMTGISSIELPASLESLGLIGLNSCSNLQSVSVYCNTGIVPEFLGTDSVKYFADKFSQSKITVNCPKGNQEELIKQIYPNLLAAGKLEINTDKITHDFIDHESGDAGKQTERCSICGVKNINYDGLDIKATTVTYNGKQQTATITGIDASYYDVTNNTATDARKHTVTLTGKGEYNGTREVEWIITQKEVTPSITGKAIKTFDGTTAVLEDNTLAISLDGVCPGDELTASASTYEYEDSNANAEKNICAKGITLDGASKNNYVIAASVMAKVGQINKATPAYTKPSDLTGVCGKTLSTVELPDGFFWTDDTNDKLVGESSKAETTVIKNAKFVPTDSVNYSELENIPIEITIIHDLKHQSNGDGTHSEKCQGCTYKTTLEKCSGGTATCEKRLYVPFVEKNMETMKHTSMMRE